MTVDFSSGYVAPGIFIEDDVVPLATTTGIDPQVVCLVGPALGYQQGTVSVQIDATTPQVLANATAYATGVNAPLVTKADGTTVLTAGTDYTATVDTNGLLNIVRVNTSSAIANGDTVVVTYRWTTDAYYNVQSFFDYDSLVALYGTPLYQPQPGSLSSPPANQVVSPLALAAKIAFENGANQVITVAADLRGSTTLRDALKAAYDKVLTDFRVGIIVPLLYDVDNQGVTTILSTSIAEGYAQDLRDHCVAATLDGNPRIGLIGLPNGFTTTGGYQNFEDLATFLASSRVIVTYPEALLYFNGYTNTTLTLDGYYATAACAGRLSALPVNKPLTKEVISSFAGIPGSIQQIQTRAVKDAIAKSGVTVLEVDRFNRLVVRHGLSTNYAGGLLYREPSVIRQRDQLFRMVDDGLNLANIIGDPIEAGTPLAIKGIVAGVLQQAVQQDVIQDYKNLLVRVRSNNPSVIEIKFSYQPALPLNYVVVSFSLDVQTGETDLAQAA